MDNPNSIERRAPGEAPVMRQIETPYMKRVRDEEFARGAAAQKEQDVSYLLRLAFAIRGEITDEERASEEPAAKAMIERIEQTVALLDVAAQKIESANLPERPR